MRVVRILYGFGGFILNKWTTVYVMNYRWHNIWFIQLSKVSDWYILLSWGTGGRVGNRGLQAGGSGGWDKEAFSQKHYRHLFLRTHILLKSFPEDIVIWNYYLPPISHRMISKNYLIEDFNVKILKFLCIGLTVRYLNIQGRNFLPCLWRHH